MKRAVDRAMSEDRPEKKTMRRLWADQVEDAAGQADQSAEPGPSEPPLYLTLAGANGLDIEELIKRKVIERAENQRAIAEKDLHKVVAVESDQDAVLELGRRFSGLHIIEDRIENVLQMPSDLYRPSQKRTRLLRARVINLDFDDPLVAQLDQGQLRFPVVRMAEKLGRLHAMDPYVNWSLCLTLHADLKFASGAEELAISLLSDNFDREPAYAAASRALLGAELFSRLSSKRGAKVIGGLEPSEAQAFLMVLVPKSIVERMHSQGWKVITHRNLRYGRTPKHAPMVSWIIHFEWDPRGTSKPREVYREGLTRALSGIAQLDGRGQITALN